MNQLLATIFKYRFFLFLAVYVILQYYDYSETAFIIFMIAIVDLAYNYQKNKKKEEYIEPDSAEEDVVIDLNQMSRRKRKAKKIKKNE